jgi:four helix bundle protein
MWARHVEDLVAYQLARELKREVYRILGEHPAAGRDLSFRDQLSRASSRVEACIAEGHARGRSGEFLQFLRYALASLKETEVWLQDGVDRGHYGRAAIKEGIVLARRCHAASGKLAETIRRTASGQLRARTAR